MKRILMRSVAVVSITLSTMAVGSIAVTWAAAAPKATTISDTAHSGCVVMVNHSVECWGYNVSGELGDGSFNDSLVPIHVHGIKNAVSVTVGGDDHACALLMTGRIKCWGDNSYGELGNGSNSLASDVPVYVSGILDATRVTAGYYHNCALLVSGAAKCWGYNAYGELGDGNILNAGTPVQVSGMKKNVTWISGGTNFTCAVQAGAAKCWGYNAYGELGDGTTTDSHVPRKVAGLEPHTSVVNAGYYQACALEPTARSGSGLECWGYNAYGELGDGTTTDRHVPVKVRGMQTHVTSISPDYDFTCAVRAGSAKCWGTNFYGQIGDGTTTDRHLPRQVFGLASGVVKISAGRYSACATLSRGAAKCWGFNGYGELGDNSTESSATPVRVHLI